MLVTFENEAIAIGAELGTDKFDIVYPSLSIEACRAGRRGREGGRQEGHAQSGHGLPRIPVLAAGQEIIAKHAFRPRNEEVLRK